MINTAIKADSIIYLNEKICATVKTLKKNFLIIKGYGWQSGSWALQNV